MKNLIIFSCIPQDKSSINNPAFLSPRTDSDSADLGVGSESLHFQKVPQLILVRVPGTGGHSKGWPGLHDLTLLYFYSINFLPLPLLLSAPVIFYFKFPGRVVNKCWLPYTQYPLPEIHTLPPLLLPVNCYSCVGPAGYHFLQEGSLDATPSPQGWNFFLTHLWIPSPQSNAWYTVGVLNKCMLN